MIRSNERRGFTLIEMLVTMAIIAFLAAMAMVMVPGILEKDRSVDAVSNLEGWLQISRARALRDKSPRGIRLIVDPTKPATERLWVTEAQYIESPPVLVVNLTPPYPTATGFPNGVNATTGALNPLSPRVEFAYTVTPPPVSPATTPLGGVITSRQCTIAGLDIDQANQIINSATGGRQPSMWLPVLGTWHRIKSTSGVLAPSPQTTPASFYVNVELDGYPDMQLGINTSYRAYHFGIYGPPRPLLGEPVMQLPTNTCVDLNQNVSLPAGSTALDYDILFAPSGQLAFTASTVPNGAIGGAGHVFLCVRDPRKVTLTSLYNLAEVQQGGEMMIVAIKAKSGAVGAAPVDHAGDPYFLAKQSIAGQ